MYCSKILIQARKLRLNADLLLILHGFLGENYFQVVITIRSSSLLVKNRNENYNYIIYDN